MKGVHLVTDPEGKVVAVQLDLEVWGEVWEDIYDGMILDERKNEPTRPFSEFLAEFEAENAAKVHE